LLVLRINQRFKNRWS